MGDGKKLFLNVELRYNYEKLFFERFEMEHEEKRRVAEFLIKTALYSAFSEIKCIFKFEDALAVVSSDEDFFDIRGEKIVGKLRRIFAGEFAIYINFDVEDGAKKRDELSDFEKARKIIRRKYLYDNFNINSVAQMMGIEPFKLDELFRKNCGMKAKEYLKSVRVEKACDLMRFGSTLETCAELCGFSSQKTMSRAFIEVLGTTPGKRRREILKDRKDIDDDYDY